MGDTHYEPISISKRPNWKEDHQPGDIDKNMGVPPVMKRERLELHVTIIYSVTPFITFHLYTCRIICSDAFAKQWNVSRPLDSPRNGTTLGWNWVSET
jgi:hypothetical protein